MHTFYFMGRLILNDAHNNISVLALDQNTQNKIRHAISEVIGWDADRCHLYSSDNNELIVLLGSRSEIDEAQRDAVRRKILSVSSFISIDIMTKEEFDNSHFVIQTSGSFGRDISLSIMRSPEGSFGLIPAQDILSKTILNTIKQIPSDLTCDENFLELLGPNSWVRSSATTSTVDNATQLTVISKTVAYFKQCLQGQGEVDDKFLGFLDRLSGYFRDAISSSRQHGLPALIFSASSRPYEQLYTPDTNVHIKLFLLLYITYKEYTIKGIFETKEAIKLRRRTKSETASYLERSKDGQSIKSKDMTTLIEKYGLKRTLESFRKSKADFSRNIAQSILIFFSQGETPAHRPINKYLEKMGFSQLTTMPSVHF
jgi:hypothetical protein